MGIAPGYQEQQWADFLDYERLVQEMVRGRRLICMCSYCADPLGSGSHLQVMDQHDLAVSSAKLSLSRLQPLDAPLPVWKLISICALH